MVNETIIIQRFFTSYLKTPPKVLCATFSAVYALLHIFCTKCFAAHSLLFMLCTAFSVAHALRHIFCGSCFAPHSSRTFYQSYRHAAH
jgi:hypothetical protein